MSPKGPLHEDVRHEVNEWLRSLPRSLGWLAENTLHLGEEAFVEPDYIIFAARPKVSDMDPSDVLLAIEVADESWQYDTGEKAARYADQMIFEGFVPGT